MKSTITLAFIALLLAANVWAEEPAPCYRLTGSWYGAFWYKDPKDCHRNHGCRHSVLASVTYTKGVHYRAEVHPHVGREGVYDITCEKGNVKSADNPGMIMFSCLDKTICQIKYDDDTMSANLLGTHA